MYLLAYLLCFFSYIYGPRLHNITSGPGRTKFHFKVLSVLPWSLLGGKYSLACTIGSIPQKFTTVVWEQSIVLIYMTTWRLGKQDIGAVSGPFIPPLQFCWGHRVTSHLSNGNLLGTQYWPPWDALESRVGVSAVVRNARQLIFRQAQLF